MKDWYFSPLEDSIKFPQNTFFIINKKELSDNDLSKLTQLLQKLKDTDIDWDSIADQASDWADKLKDLDLDIDINTDGLWDKICEFFKSLLESLKNLFGK